MKKLLLSFVFFFTSSLLFSQTFLQPTQFNNVCDDNNDGFATFFMQEITFEIIQNQPNLVVTHHLTQVDAASGNNPLPTTYTNSTNPQLIFARIVNTITNQVQIITYNLTVNIAPQTTSQVLTACPIIAGGTGVFDLNTTILGFTMGQSVNVSFHYTLVDAQTSSNGINPNVPFVNMISNQQLLYVRVANSTTDCATITSLLLVVVNCGGGQPVDLYACSNGIVACFDLNLNNQNILGTLNPNDYALTYHTTQNDAQTGINPIISTQGFCTSEPITTIYARLLKIADSTFEIMSFNLVISIPPPVPTQVITACSNNVQCWDLTSIIPNVTNGQNCTVDFYLTQQNAIDQTNPIVNTQCFISPLGAPIQPPLYFRVNCVNQANCVSIGMVELVIIDCSTCGPPLAVTATAVSGTTAVIAWTSNSVDVFQNDLIIQPAGGPAPLPGSAPSAILSGGSTTFTFDGLFCNSTYEVYVRSHCPQGFTTWIGPAIFTTQSCIQHGFPQNLSGCADGNNDFCFDLTVNNQNVLGTLNPNDYTITYHLSQSDAATNFNPLTSPFCLPQGFYTLFVRLANNIDSTTTILPFQVTVTNNIQSSLTIPPIVQCDDNNNGLIEWDLTVVEAQINTTNPLSYYISLASAQAMSGPITNPSSWSTNVQTFGFIIFIREEIDGDCDIIYSVALNGQPNCNLASTCGSANSLCNSLGVPFPNTIGIPSSGQSGCLNTTPNPTWFYLPVSSAGIINLQITQTSNLSGFSDVDYIVYGPFSNPITPCGNTSLLMSNIVSCSYSASATEYPIIPNAQPGQYYLLMVTNFSNQPGLITITELGSTQGAIDCSGLRLNAFLDSNNNGTQENGEPNFPLGQFHYEKNNDGVIHNITAPSGTYNIYDINPSNTYDVSYSIQASYSSMYAVSPSSYDNISVVIGSGLITYNFPLTVIQPYNDLAVTIIPIDQPRPGFIYSNKIIYANLGNQTIPSGTLTFNKDSNVTISSISQSGTTTTSNGFTYNFSNLLPFEVRNITVYMQVPTIPIVNAGQYLTNTASIEPLAGDIVPENNESTLAQIVVNAYDPNDKMESRGAQILHSTFTSEDYLYYTIRFENTGTASAINVRINDVLDEQLDQTTVRMVDASHPYILDRIGSNLTWRFDNIQLPVSIANTTIGKGYITFKVKPQAGYAVGDIIANTAAIYFDFNPAIVTNTFTTEFTAPLTNENFNSSSFVLYPNPSNGTVNISLQDTAELISKVSIADLIGKTIFEESNIKSNQTLLNLYGLSNGVYLIEIETENGMKANKKLIIK